MNASYHHSTMSLEIAPVADAEPLPACTPSLMPFHISYSGPAPISRYFRPRPAPPPVAALSARSSSSATLVTSSSSTSTLDETNIGLTATASVTSVKCEEDELLPKPTEMEQVAAARLPADVSMEVDSETQPALGAVPLDSVSRSTHVHTHTARSVERFLAAFRGRQMCGQAVDIPTGYGGLVLRAPMDAEGKSGENATASSQPLSRKTRSGRVTTDHVTRDESDARDEDSDVDPAVTRKLIPSSTFTSFMLWAPDRPPDEGNDEYARALTEWIHLANEIHSYDE